MAHCNLTQYVLLLAGTLVMFFGPDLAWAQKKGAKNNRDAQRRPENQAAIKQLQAHLTSANQRLAAATIELTLAQRKAAAAQGVIATAGDDLKNSKSEADTNSQRLREIEQQLEAAQPKDSPFAEAKADYAQAKQALDAAAEEFLAAADSAGSSESVSREAAKAGVVVWIQCPNRA